MRTAEDLFQELCSLDLRLLKMKGGGSRTYYVPGSAIVARVEFATAANQPPEQNSHQVAQHSHQLEAHSHQLLATVPGELKRRIPEKGTKPRREVLRVLILDLCRWKAMSARELAAILGRQDHKPLVRDYLSPMVAEDLLAYTIPEMENHPDQRYTVPAVD